MTDRNRIFERIRSGREAVRSGAFPSVKERRKTLRRMLVLLVSHSEAAYSVLADDLGRSRQNAVISEFLPLIRSIKGMIRRLPSLAAPRRRRVSWINFPARGRAVPFPYGHVLIAGAWDLPLLSTLRPLIGAYAAGNRVVVKLPGRARKSALFIQWLVEETFLGDEVVAVGGEAGFRELAEWGFDCIYHADAAAAEAYLKEYSPGAVPFLRPPCGKSPAIVDSGAALKQAANRIVQGKFFNAGQNGVAPEIVFVHERVREPFVRYLGQALRRFCGGEEPLTSPQTGRIIDGVSYERLSRMSGSGRLLFGGEKDPRQLKISPAVIDRLDADDPLLGEVIMGPLLPLAVFRSEEELMGQLARYSPLPAVYYFGRDRSLVRRLVREVPSRDLVVNDAVTQLFNAETWDDGFFFTFSRMKDVMIRPAFFDGAWRSLPLRGIAGWLADRMVGWSI